MIPVLIEAALRALLVAATVWVGLRLFRVRNVPAQKAAWGLVLVSAVAMPLVMRWQILPDSLALKIPAKLWSAAPEALPIRDALLLSSHAEGLVNAPQARLDAGQEPAAGGGDRYPAPSITHYEPAVADQTPQVVRRPQLAQSLQADDVVVQAIETQPEVSQLASRVAAWVEGLELGRVAFGLYLAVCAVLLVRMAYGLDRAMRLWWAAEIFVPYPQDDPGYGLPMRFSRAVASPVTIGSGVLLPYECLEWDREKLRVVLAHERAHIRQGDFYLQLLAGIYAAVFWFSPLGWWLKDKLSDLSEAISDHAGLNEAESRASYAQMLLEFAALPRPTFTGVAMARSRNLSDRIECLLNETNFRQAFAGGRKRVLLAVLLVPVAVFAGTALIRVEAASAQEAQQTPAATPAPAAAPNAAQPAMPSAPSSDPASDAQPPAPAAEPQAAPQPAPAPDVVPPPLPGAPGVVVVAPLPPMAPMAGQVHISADAMAEMSKRIQAEVNARVQNDVKVNVDAIVAEALAASAAGRSSGHGYSYSYNSNGDSWALITDPSGRVRFSGDWNDGTRATIDKVRKLTSGKFLWFTHDGKSYFIDDAATVAQVEAMEKPIEELGREQEKLGKEQEALGRQQEEMGRKQEQASVPTPDISKEMASLNEAVAKLNAKKGSTVSQEELAEIEGRIGDIQGKLGELQGRMGERQGEFGEAQAKLGEEQGKLGEQQGRLGEQQGKLSQEADRKVKSIIDESLKNGKARPVE
jgi:BlaR1 peptidase M56